MFKELRSPWFQTRAKNLNYGEFAIIKSQAGLNSYKISVKEWVEKTNAIGLRASAGRYGGTYAHKDIAFEFAAWISVEFKLYLIKEFQRLKDDESERLKLGWNLQRTLAKINYRIHTDAIKETLIPPAVSKSQANLVYANEADLLITQASKSISPSSISCGRSKNSSSRRCRSLMNATTGPAGMKPRRRPILTAWTVI